ncbi:MAG: von Willebrand factor type A domain-containing protein [Myxococcota bacterium]
MVHRFLGLVAVVLTLFGAARGAAQPVEGPIEAPFLARENAVPVHDPGDVLEEGDTGLTGLVIDADADGATLGGVEVTVLRYGTVVRRVLTTLGGRYQIRLPPGVYELRFQLAFYRSGRIENVRVRAGRIEYLEELSLSLDTSSLGEAAVTNYRIDTNTEAAQTRIRGGSDRVSQEAFGGRRRARRARRRARPADVNHARSYRTAPPLAPPLAPPRPVSREGYRHVDVSPFVTTAADARSTFAIDVDTASYTNVRRHLLREDRLPPPDAVRLEEMVNYFRYEGRRPAGAHPVGPEAEVRVCPWNAEHLLMRVALRTAPLPTSETPPRNLVFLVDVSGSMAAPFKLALVRQGLTALVGELRAQDRVAIVVYAGASGVVLPPTPGDRRRTIRRALARLEAGGSTHGAAGIELAYQLARASFHEGGVNRVILATDGDFNVGPSSEGELVRLIERERASGVFLTVLGVGFGDFQDAHMEALADHGNGNYAYIDSLREAKRVLVREASATLVTVAQDVKIQVELNPTHVARHRLLGYENRLLAHQDFRNDARDAGEVGAGHQVTAFYELVPWSASDARGPDVPASRYQRAQAASTAAHDAEIAFVRVRYQRPRGSRGRELALPVPRPAPAALRATPSDAFRFGSAVAGFALWLREDPLAKPNLRALRLQATGSLGPDPHGLRAELLAMMGRAERLRGER